MKLQFSLFVLLVVSSLGQRVHESREQREENECPRAKPLPNFNWANSLGVWYNYASSTNYDDVDANCFKKNYFKLFQNSTLFFEESQINPDGSLDDSNTTRPVDPRVAGVLKTTKHVTLTDKSGKKYNTTVAIDSIIVYTDYTNLQLRYACTMLKNYPRQTKFEYYFVLARNRNFDSVKLYIPVIQTLQSLGVTSKNIAFLKQNNCTN